MNILSDVNDPDLCCEILIVLNCFTIEFSKGIECLSFFKDTLVTNLSKIVRHEYLEEKLMINLFRLLKNLLSSKVLMAWDFNKDAKRIIRKLTICLDKNH